MTTMTIPENERGHARLFAVDLPSDQAELLTAGQISELLGVESLPEGGYEYFPVSDLDDLGVAGYLTQGMGMDPGPVRADASRLDALRGHLLVLPSAAVRGKTLNPRAPLRWIGTYSEAFEPAPMERLQSDAAEGTLSGPPGPSQGAVLGRVATVALLVLAALVILMIFIS